MCSDRIYGTLDPRVAHSLLFLITLFTSHGVFVTTPNFGLDFSHIEEYIEDENVSTEDANNFLNVNDDNQTRNNNTQDMVDDAKKQYKYQLVIINTIYYEQKDEHNFSYIF